MSHLDCITEQDGFQSYTQILDHISLKLALRVVVLDQHHKEKTRYALFFSTDLYLDAVTLFHWYNAHFQSF